MNRHSKLVLVRLGVHESRCHCRPFLIPREETLKNAIFVIPESYAMFGAHACFGTSNAAENSEKENSIIAP